MADDEPEEEQPSTLSEDEEIEARLAAFDQKVRRAGSKRMPDVPSWEFDRTAHSENSKMPQEAFGHRSVGIGLAAAYTLAGSMILGFGVGWLLDRKYHTEPIWSAGLGLTGMFLGLVYVFVLIARSNR